MDALGMAQSLSAKSVGSLGMPSGLVSTAERDRSQFLKLTKSSPNSSTHSLHCRPRKGNGAVKAVLMEPTNRNESARLAEYKKLSEDLNSIRTSSNSSSIAPNAVTSANASTDFQFSGSVEEALHSHAAKLKLRSLTHDAERMRREMIPLHQLRQGGFPENSLMYRQLFVIRSYEVGPDKSTSIKEIFSLFQEMALNHVQLLGIAGDGFGATRTMNRLGLIWVVTKMQVDVDRYPVWPEVIEIDSWVAHAGKNGMRRDWIMRSYQSGEVLARATSTWCMMNGTTRRLSKIPDEVRTEIEPNFIDHRSAFSQDEAVAPRITKLDDVSTQYQSSQLKPTSEDLDMNQHVNNLKYINWVLGSIPTEHLQTHKLESIVLEYRRECHSTDIVESLTSSKIDVDNDSSKLNMDCNNPNDMVRTGELNKRFDATRQGCCQYTHLLRLQDAGHQEILRGRTTWRSRTSSS